MIYKYFEWLYVFPKETAMYLREKNVIKLKSSNQEIIRVGIFDIIICVYNDMLVVIIKINEVVLSK